MVAEQLAAVRLRMADAADRVGRNVDDVELVAISKSHGADLIMEAYEAGHRVFGENRADELVAKAAALPDDIVWHFVGRLQSRKVPAVAAVASVIHSIDRPKLLHKLSQWAATDGSVPAAYVQVNVAGEEQKGGAAPTDVPGLLSLAAGLEIPVSGLMLIPPLTEDADLIRSWFTDLRTLRDDLADRFPYLAGLSMGMTDDFELAIEEGATAIRVGRAIFGERRGGAAA